MVEFAPMETLSSTNVFKNSSGGFLDFGNLSFVKVTFGPIKTLFPMVMPSQICTPFLIVTLSPIYTSFSMKQ